MRSLVFPMPLRHGKFGFPNRGKVLAFNAPIPEKEGRSAYSGDSGHPFQSIPNVCSDPFREWLVSG